jgi:hypothetical protein
MNDAALFPMRSFGKNDFTHAKTAVTGLPLSAMVKGRRVGKGHGKKKRKDGVSAAHLFWREVFQSEGDSFGWLGCCRSQSWAVIARTGAWE